MNRVLSYISRVAKSQDIRKKLLITLLILVIYRLCAHIPVPGVDRTALASVLQGGGAGQTLVQILNLLSGGTISNFSVMAMGVYPYITAQIIIQLLVPIIPAWKQRSVDDQREFQKWMEKTTMLLAIPMAALQAVGQINILSSFAGTPILQNFGLGASQLLSTFSIVITMTAGTLFAIWLGELISEYGVRKQGLSLIIFAGIVAQIPSSLAQLTATDSAWILLLFMLLFTGLTVYLIVYIQQGRRNVPVMYPGRRVGSRMSMPVRGSLPLMVNMSGMIPLIFASSLLTFPAILFSFFTSAEAEWLRNFALNAQNWFGGGSWGYWLVYFFMVVVFTFFYTEVVFAQQNYGENLRKAGAQIPGVLRGEKTQEYLTKVLRRITLPGALFLGLIAVLPYLTSLLLPAFGLAATGVSQQTGLFLVSSSGLLIVVGVVRDIFYNIDAELKLHGYDETLLVK